MKMSNKNLDFISIDPYRLPRNVIPLRYNLKIVPNLDTATFWGTVIVKLSVKTQTNTIMLNSKNLNIISIRINKKLENNFKIDSKTERLIITTRKMLKPGIVCLRIHFAKLQMLHPMAYSYLSFPLLLVMAFRQLSRPCRMFILGLHSKIFEISSIRGFLILAIFPLSIITEDFPSISFATETI